MSIHKTVSIQDVIDLLNAAIEADPVAMHTLTETRVACNESLSMHPTIQVAAVKGARYDSNGKEELTLYSVGLLGILNGIFGTDENGWGAIAAQFNVNCPSGCELPDEDLVVGNPCPVCTAELILGQLQKFMDNGRR